MTLPSEMKAQEDWARQEMMLVREVFRLVARSLEPEVSLREMLHLLSELLGLNRGRIVLLNPDSDDLHIRYAYGLTSHEIARGRYRPREGITGRVMATGQSAIIQDIDADPMFLARAVDRDRLPQETVAFIAVPIEINGRVKGVLACHRIRHRKRALTDDLDVLKIMATMVGQVLHLSQIVEQRTAALEQRNRALQLALERGALQHGIISESPLVQNILTQLERVAALNATVLLLGESGTGKELFALATHLASPRRDKPFIKVNCAAIPENLFESELFGHEKGSFTGAHLTRNGWFEQADGGTLFLDEIGELPLAMQSKLLRTLQDGIITRVGGKREIHTDVRLVAATNRDIELAVRQGHFRKDLFYRINVVPICLPPLRERTGDVKVLAMHFANRASLQYERNVYLTEGALERLQLYDWPGNIRELINVIERLVLLSNGPAIVLQDVDAVLKKYSSVASITPPDDKAVNVIELPLKGRQLATLVREYKNVQDSEADGLMDALKRNGGNKSRAAQSVGLTARQFTYRLDKLGLIKS